MKNQKHLNMRGFLSFLILHELNKKPLCGDELSDKIGKRKGSKLTPGTIYPTLKRLKRLNLVRMKQTGRKKNYFLTKSGKNELKITYRIFNDLFLGLKGQSIFGGGSTGIAHFAHIGGALIGFLMMWYWKKNQFHSNRWN